MCTICCKGRLAGTASVCNASRTPRHARSAVGSKWALAAGSEKPLLAFAQGQQTQGRGLKRSATTRKRRQALLRCLRPPAHACAVALVLQRTRSAYTCLRIARRFYPQSLKKSTTNTRKGTSSLFLHAPTCRRMRYGSFLTMHTQGVHTSAHRTKLLPALSERSTRHTRKGPQTLFFLPMPACKCVRCDSLLTVHTHLCTS